MLSAYDLDEDDTLYYSLNGPDLSYFQIDQSGIITATRQLLKQDYSITATVSDHGNLNSSVGLGFYVSEAMRFPIFEVLSSNIHKNSLLIMNYELSLYTFLLASLSSLFAYIYSGSSRELITNSALFIKSLRFNHSYFDT